MATIAEPVSIAGTVARASASSERAFAFSVQSQCLSSVSSAGRTTPVAALCTITRYGPAAAIFAIVDSEATLPRTRSTSAPAARISPAAASAAESLRRYPSAIRVAPSRTSRSAIAFPIPRVPPVTRAAPPGLMTCAARAAMPSSPIPPASCRASITSGPAGSNASMFLSCGPCSTTIPSRSFRPWAATARPCAFASLPSSA